MTVQAELSSAILDTALELAETLSWERLRLHDIADKLGITLDDIRVHFPQKDDLVEAWYDRADSTMLQAAAAPEFSNLNMRERLQRIILSWLDALAAHQKVSRDMLLYKLEPGHVHLQILGILRISRTVQWFREAAQQDSTHLLRILEEIGLTSIFVASFIHWMNDRSEHQQRTREFLSHRLREAEALATRFQRFYSQSRSQPN